MSEVKESGLTSYCAKSQHPHHMCSGLSQILRPRFAARRMTGEVVPPRSMAKVVVPPRRMTGKVVPPRRMTGKVVPPRRMTGEVVPPRSVKKVWLAAFAMLAAVMMAFGGTTSAQAATMTWSVSPATASSPDKRPRFEYTVDPGTVTTDYVAVSNFGDSDVTYRVYAADASTDYDSGDFGIIAPNQPSTDVGAWTTVADKASSCDADDPALSDDKAMSACMASIGTTVTVPAGKAAVMPISISVPADATPGDHAGAILASVESTGSGGVGINNRVGTRIYLRVNGELKPAMTISGQSTHYSGGWHLWGGGEATASFEIHNEGNTMVDVQPRVQFTGPFGIKLAEAKGKQFENIIPGGVAHAQITLDGVNPLFLLFAHVTAEQQPSQPADPVAVAAGADATAFAIPWGWVCIVLAAALGVWLWQWLRKRRRARLKATLRAYAAQVQGEAAADAVAGGSVPVSRASPATSVNESSTQARTAVVAIAPEENR